MDGNNNYLREQEQTGTKETRFQKEKEETSLASETISICKTVTVPCSKRQSYFSARLGTAGKTWGETPKVGWREGSSVGSYPAGYVIPARPKLAGASIPVSNTRTKSFKASL